MKKSVFGSLGVAIFLCIVYGLTQGWGFPHLHDYSTSGDSLVQLKPSRRHLMEAKVTLQLLIDRHYKQITFDDSLSAVAFGHFIKLMDGGRMYFTAQEIQDFEQKYATNLDQMILGGQLQPIYDVYALYRARVLEYVSYTQACLEKGFDFAKEEYLNAKPETRLYTPDKQSMQDRWRKTIKNEAIMLRLSGKEEKETKEILSKRRRSLRNWLLRINSEDVFQDFMSTVAQSFDPHSTYFSAVHAENFNIDMSKSLEGIGARLYQDADYITIQALIPGGPAFKTKAIEPADRIVGVAEGDSSSFVDVIGWRVTEAVQLIRGKKGTIVRLLILPAQAPPNGVRKEVRIVRDKIMLKDAIATQKTYTINRNQSSYKLGVITLPSFYVDWEAKQSGTSDYQSATHDVKRCLKSLEKEKVNGILIDLRKNGGGALLEAIQLTGLFIETGPIVQVQNQERALFIQTDPDPSISYTGPIAVLVDRFSASASRDLRSRYTRLPKRTHFRRNHTRQRIRTEPLSASRLLVWPQRRQESRQS